MTEADADERRLHRLLKVAGVDGWSLLVLAAPSALLAACSAEWFVALASAGAALCGLLELHGRRRLAQGRDPAGLGWLCAAQLACLAVLLGYSLHLSHVASDTTRLRTLLPPALREQLVEAGLDAGGLDRMLVQLQRLVAGLLALVSLCYQGGLAWYYLRSGPAIRRALALPPPLG